jgi:hypothetical protein
LRVLCPQQQQQLQMIECKLLLLLLMVGVQASMDKKRVESDWDVLLLVALLPICVSFGQVEEKVEHIFEAHIIQRMELLVLSTLDWWMSSVTPFSYFDYYFHKLQISGFCHKSVRSYWQLFRVHFFVHFLSQYLFPSVFFLFFFCVVATMISFVFDDLLCV